MVTIEGLLGNQLSVLVIISLVVFALVSRYLTAKNERLLISVGEQNKLESASRAWILTAILLFFFGIGMIVQSYLNSTMATDFSGIILVFVGFGIGLSKYINDWIHSEERDDNGGLG